MISEMINNMSKEETNLMDHYIKSLKSPIAHAHCEACKKHESNNSCLHDQLKRLKLQILKLKGRIQ